MKSGEVREYLYLGPDGYGVGELPPWTGAALGSEYCVHLLPTAERLAAATALAREKNVPLLLLTPYFRDAELKRFLPLFRTIPEEAEVDVAVNDWGLLLTLRVLIPRLRLSVGRLLSGQKHCPRIGISPRLTERGRGWHRDGLFSSRSAARFLAREFGVTGFHVDYLPAGPPPSASFPALWVHGPWSIVTLSDDCPWIGGCSSASVLSCDRPCLAGSVALREPTMGKGMIQKGKARFAAANEALPGGRLEGSQVRRVRYGAPP